MQKIFFFPLVKTVLGQLARGEFPSILALTLKLTQTLMPTGGGGGGNFLWGELSGTCRNKRNEKPK